MTTQPEPLPDDLAAAHAMILAQREQLALAKSEVTVGRLEIERLKLHILNLGHTVLADIWMKENRPADETVRQILVDAGGRERLLSLYRGEVIPGFAANGLGRQAEDYVATTLERFDNPFLDHRLGDIASHHAEKLVRRIAAFRAWAPDVPMPGLTAIVGQ